MGERLHLPVEDQIIPNQALQRAAEIIDSKLHQGIETHQYAEQPFDFRRLSGFGPNNPLSIEDLESEEGPNRVISITKKELDEIGKFCFIGKKDGHFGIVTVSAEKSASYPDDFNLVIFPENVGSKTELIGHKLQEKYYNVAFSLLNDDFLLYIFHI